MLLLDWVALGVHEERYGYGQVQNLRGYTLVGEHASTAQHPTNTSNDFYTQIRSTSPLVVANFIRVDCRIDPITGRLLEQEFPC